MQERILANSTVAADGPLIGEERCWLWMGKRVTSNRGLQYPVLTMRIASGRRKGKVVNVRVHRLVVQLFNDRRVTSRMVVQHLCNNSLCVNPAHLAGGTQKENVRQTVADGRHRNGHTGKLT